jgi:hypothetical protein
MRQSAAIEAITPVGLKDGTIPVSVGADISAMLGPIAAVVTNMGDRYDLVPS